MLEQKQFAGETMAAAKKAADQWWVRQTDLNRVSDYMSSANEHLIQRTGDRWLANIIYEKARPRR